MHVTVNECAICKFDNVMYKKTLLLNKISTHVTKTEWTQR